MFDANGRGYVYLPGPGERWYELNTRSILRRGFEGQWYFATKEWQQFVNPYLARVR